MRNLILPFILLLTFVFSCRENDADEGLEQKNTTYDVYVAGSDNNKACYWKNNVLTYLTNGDNIKAEKIIVENNNIYVFAAESFWKNNVKSNLYTYLGVPSNNNPLISLLEVKSFYVKDNDIYVVGSIRGPVNLASGVATYTIEHCYWKNGVKNVLFANTGSSTGGFLSDITIHNNDIYIAATKFITSSNWQLGYFKNGIYTAVNSGSFLGINSNSSGVFIGIFDQNNSYYKDLITNTDHYMTTNVKAKVVLDNNDIYSFYQNTYYKNGNAININNPNGYNDIKDLKVVNNKTYMICEMFHQMNSLDIAYKVYINGVENQQITHTANNVNLGGSFNSIYVVEN